MNFEFVSKKKLRLRVLELRRNLDQIVMEYAFSKAENAQLKVDNAHLLKRVAQAEGQKAFLEMNLNAAAERIRRNNV